MQEPLLTQPLESPPLSIGPDTMRGDFLKLINHISRQNINRCWHCTTCGGGCPFSDHMDLMPNQVIRMVQLGNRQEVLESKTIWLCVGCYTCSGQCPNNIDIASIMDALRQIAIHDGVSSREKDIFLFHKYIYGSISRNGRLNKLSAMTRFKLGTGHLFSDISDGVRMVMKGKLELTGKKVHARNEIHRIFAHYDDRRRSFDANE